MQEEEDRIKKEEEEYKRQEEEEEKLRLDEIKKKQDAIELRQKNKEQKIAELKKKGEFKTKGQIIREKQDAQRIQMMISAGLMQEGMTQVAKEEDVDTQVKKTKKKKKIKEDIYAVKDKEEVVEDWEQMLSEED